MDSVGRSQHATHQGYNRVNTSDPCYLTASGSYQKYNMVKNIYVSMEWFHSKGHGLGCSKSTGPILVKYKAAILLTGLEKPYGGIGQHYLR